MFWLTLIWSRTGAPRWFHMISLRERFENMAIHGWLVIWNMFWKPSPISMIWSKWAKLAKPSIHLIQINWQIMANNSMTFWIAVFTAFCKILCWSWPWLILTHQTFWGQHSSVVSRTCVGCFCWRTLAVPEKNTPGLMFDIYIYIWYIMIYDIYIYIYLIYFVLRSYQPIFL
jgi:hypothetical protein